MKRSVSYLHVDNSAEVDTGNSGELGRRYVPRGFINAGTCSSVLFEVLIHFRHA